MGGRAAEEIVFDSVTTGASNDIEQATKHRQGHGDPVRYVQEIRSYGSGESQANQYLDGRTVMNCSDATAAEVDDGSHEDSSGVLR